MNSKNKLVTTTAIFLLVLLIVTSILSISLGTLNKSFTSFFAIGCILLLFIFEYFFRINKIMLPHSFIFISLSYIFLSLFLGEIIEFYSILSWWDLLLHFIAGIYLPIIALSLMQGIFTKHIKTSRNRYIILIIIFAFSLSIAIGTIFEQIEFISDYFFKSTMVKGGLYDTITDLLANIIGSFITCIFYYVYCVKNKSKLI